MGSLHLPAGRQSRAQTERTQPDLFAKRRHVNRPPACHFEWTAPGIHVRSASAAPALTLGN